MSITRRTFIQTAASGAAVASLPLAAVARSIRGVNEDIRVGVVGLNGRGGSHINGFRRLEGVRVVALCDVDRSILARNVERFERRHGGWGLRSCGFALRAPGRPRRRSPKRGETTRRIER